jgi:hypothetical protein
MELYFNEISAKYKTTNIHESQQRMLSLIELCKKAKKQGFNLFRTFREFDNIELSDGYRIYDWYSDVNVKNTIKSFYLGFRKFPFETTNEESEKQYIECTYKLKEADEINHNNAIVNGLALAYIENSISISFPANKVWEKEMINLKEKRNNSTSEVKVHHASLDDHIDIHKDWIDSLNEITIIETELNPKEKNVHLREDHGKDKLTLLANKLIKSPFVLEVINSIDFKPYARKFINNTYPNGKIEIVLINSDEGFGMVIQTTGRNLKETNKIAEIIEEKYF